MNVFVKTATILCVRIISVVQRGGQRYTHLLIAVAEVVQME